jgi:hypothetical protein
VELNSDLETFNYNYMQTNCSRSPLPLRGRVVKLGEHRQEVKLAAECERLDAERIRELSGEGEQED